MPQECALDALLNQAILLAIGPIAVFKHKTLAVRNRAPKKPVPV